MDSNLESKIEACFKTYEAPISDADLSKKLTDIKDKYTSIRDAEVLKLLFSLIDLTTLDVKDNRQNVSALVNKVNEFSTDFPNIPMVGAICVYPSVVNVVSELLQDTSVGIASVSGGFPSSQTFIEVKIAETSLTIADGATEIDIVIPVGKFLNKEYADVFDDISEQKQVCGKGVKLKVILESGSLATSALIHEAAILAIEAGADFIKTSTGKTAPAATLEAAYIMCSVIKQVYDKSGKKIGFKPAGGIATTEDALMYYGVVKEVLGDAWLTPKLFRIGASRLANNLLSDITGEAVRYF